MTALQSGEAAMTFLSAWRLAFLVVPLGLLVAYLAAQRARQKTAVRFTSVDMLASVAPRRPGWQRHLPELLEHVADWQSCLNEAARVLRPGGLLYLSTTNVLCPRQQEFNLPLYSWYPAPLKRYCERLAVTTRPALAGYAKYPAVNWFSFYSLRGFLQPLGFRCLDRFDLIDTAGKSRLAQFIVTMLRRSSLLGFLGHVATPTTYLVAVKSAS